MGEDGTKGAKLVHQLGGIIIAQDENTSDIYGMPRSIVEAGLANEILPLEKISSKILDLIK